MTRSVNLILVAVQKGASTVEEIEKMTGLERPTIRYNVRNLVKQGVLKTELQRKFVPQGLPSESKLFGGAGKMMRQFHMITMVKKEEK